MFSYAQNLTIRLFIAIVLAATGSSLWSDEFVRDGKVWVQIFSRESLAEATDLADKYREEWPHLTIFSSTNGWYAVAIGQIKSPSEEHLLEEWKEVHKIPLDSLLTSGKRYADIVISIEEPDDPVNVFSPSRPVIANPYHDDTIPDEEFKRKVAKRPLVLEGKQGTPYKGVPTYEGDMFLRCAGAEVVFGLTNNNDAYEYSSEVEFVLLVNNPNTFVYDGEELTSGARDNKSAPQILERTNIESVTETEIVLQKDEFCEIWNDDDNSCYASVSLEFKLDRYKGEFQYKKNREEGRSEFKSTHIYYYSSSETKWMEGTCVEFDPASVKQKF
ncbi:SPOR domain-containing protein [Sulfitobacter mediterraneus]|uniref:SPOR domain-containing protein n=1 Tax=Sulfitobacter mediterraneus TaxID=83219 RepID=UPI0019317FB2|nr:SPOR domain-containing protein [Sulfitobacter mediterraneus]MBM1312314.1 SPOR domain-containing protein [Sulfitobacter mediterraneus]MBM1324558.1 SPOR domain-containing protein [Sulfitobacter mediterraneus]MBM1328468.1 SPOR domain-containing protein [Sulfitobacter mediterraneus]MBM1399818.1 SPOR domain-containing protein [Sulfitobacter mediterraneus]MBM1403704.1 SPOR domain-containing protein [Sulfitobacter mediterraneus]